MKVTVRTNCLSRKLKQMIEISFSTKPETSTLDELKRNRWWWDSKKGCWSHYYSEKNLDFAMKLKRKYEFQPVRVKCKGHNKRKSLGNEDPFAYLRKKTPMKRKHDYGVPMSGPEINSIYDCKSRLVLQVC